MSSGKQSVNKLVSNNKSRRRVGDTSSLLLPYQGTLSELNRLNHGSFVSSNAVGMPRAKLIQRQIVGAHNMNAVGVNMSTAMGNLVNGPMNDLPDFRPYENTQGEYLDVDDHNMFV